LANVTMPSEAPAVLDRLSRHKAGVVALLRPAEGGWSAEDWLAFYDGRAGIAEFNGGLPRAEAEARAFVCCVAEWLNRKPARSPPGRCLSCGEAEHAHDHCCRSEPSPPATPGCIHAVDGLACEPASRRGCRAFIHGNSDMRTLKRARRTPLPRTRRQPWFANDPDDRKGALRNIGGSKSDHWNNLLANQAVQALWIKNSDAETRDRQLSATVAAMVGIGPKDEMGGYAKKRGFDGMIADHMQGIEKFESELWKIADDLRANSGLASNEYFMPLMGLIFLRHATNRFYEAQAAINADKAAGRMPDRPLVEADFRRRRALMLPVAAPYDGLRKASGDVFGRPRRVLEARRA
jgi:HsdM N-terminal domain